MRGWSEDVPEPFIQLPPDDRVGEDPAERRGPEVRRLMQALVADDNRAGALSLYQYFSERLQRDLEIEPSPRTRALAAEIRGQAS